MYNLIQIITHRQDRMSKIQYTKKSLFRIFLLTAIIGHEALFGGFLDMITDKLNDTDGIENPVRGKFEFLGNLHTEYPQSPGIFDRIVSGESYMFAIDDDNIIRDDREVFNISSKKITPTIRTQKLAAFHLKAPIALKDGRILYFSEPPMPPKDGLQNTIVQSFDKTNYSFTKEAESVLIYTYRRAKLLELKDGNVLMINNPAPIMHKYKKKEGYYVAFEKYDPDSKKFTFLGTNNIPRSHFGVIQTSDEKVLIIGGYSEREGVKDPLEVEEYDPKTDKCKVIGKLLKIRAYPVVQMLPNGKILVMGGYQENPIGYHAQKHAELFDPKSGVSVPLPDSNWVAPGYSVSYMVGDQAVILSGIYAEGFDYKTNKFYKIDSVGSEAEQRNMFGCAVLPNGNAVVGGGYVERSGKHSPRDIWLLRLK